MISEGDADLHGGQETAWLGGQRQRAARTDHLALRHRLETADARRDDRHFRQGEEAIDDDEENDRRQFEEEHGFVGNL